MGTMFPEAYERMSKMDFLEVGAEMHLQGYSYMHNECETRFLSERSFSTSTRL
jgi:hypothetical protein